MPVVNVDPDELRQLTGHPDKTEDELKSDLFSLGLEFEGKTDDGDFQLEFAPDRLDRLSIEGIARSLRYQYGDESGIYIPSVNDPEWTIEVEESVPDQRPYVTGAIVRGIELDAKILDSVIQLQEKLHATMGRTRDKGAIGIHDLTMLRGEPLEGAEPREENVEKSIIYRGIEPNGDVFVPLDSDQELTPKEVLTEHSTGQEYADLVDEYDMYPAIYDDIGLFSFPPVINGRRTEVTTDTRDLFIEMTGTDQWTIDKMCTILCYALDARGGTIEEVTVRYPDRELIRPDLSTKEKRLSHERLTNMLGTELDPSTVIDLFERSGLDATYTSSDSIEYTAEIPPYRVDILHPVDLIDDVGRAYGFNTLVPQYPDVNTIGGRTEASRLENAVRTQLVGLGFEDLLNFHLINEAEIFHRMNLSPDANVFGANEPPSITEPYSEDYTIVRTWALPSIMMVLENNTHRSYPQDLAEIGLRAYIDETQPTNITEQQTVAGVIARRDASYEHVKGRLQTLARNLGVSLSTPRTEHPSFINGRCAHIQFNTEQAGVIGEIHPKVLAEHNIETPVAAFEFRLSALE